MACKSLAGSLKIELYANWHFIDIEMDLKCNVSDKVSKPFKLLKLVNL